MWSASPDSALEPAAAAAGTVGEEMSIVGRRTLEPLGCAGGGEDIGEEGDGALRLVSEVDEADVTPEMVDDGGGALEKAAVDAASAFCLMAASSTTAASSDTLCTIPRSWSCRVVRHQDEMRWAKLATDLPSGTKSRIWFQIWSCGGNIVADPAAAAAAEDDEAEATLRCEASLS